MNPLATNTANNASFQAFMNCYLREIDAGVWHTADAWFIDTGLRFDGEESHVIELQLADQDKTLAIGVTFRSIVGRHQLTHIYQQDNALWEWKKIDSLTAILLLIDNIYQGFAHKSPEAKTQQLELIARIVESHQVMTHYVDSRLDDPRLQAQDFINSEQSILFGHWLHPTPKSRQGIHAWQHQQYTPELCGEFQLDYFAVDRQLIDQGSMLDDTADAIIMQIASHSSSDTPNESNENGKPDLKTSEAIIPVHPLQTQWLLAQPHVTQLLATGQLRHLGVMGPHFTATSSVRTVYCPSLDYMLKLSIPVKITNSLRVNMQHELKPGLAVSSLLDKTRFCNEYPMFQTINDPAYITLDIEDLRESGFEVIIRENPFKIDNQNSLATGVHSIAALVQDPIDVLQKSRLHQLIDQLSLSQHRAPDNVSLDWFDAYWQCAIEPAIFLYDQHGIALEAHQQNSLLDLSHGYPSRYYYRDNQGFYLSAGCQQQLLSIEPLLGETADLFYDDEMICDRFSYYLVINQLFSVINRFGLDGLITEQVLLERTADKLQSLQPTLGLRGQQLIDAILHRREIPCKGNLLTRIDDVDELQADLELAVYTTIKNPLHDLAFTLNPSKASRSQSLAMPHVVPDVIPDSIPDSIPDAIPA